MTPRDSVYPRPEAAPTLTPRPQTGDVLPGWRKALALMTLQDRIRACWALVASLFAALSSGAMIWSVLPFLKVLLDPDAIQNSAGLRTVHDRLGQPEPYNFVLFLGGMSILLVVGASLAQVLRTVAVAHFAATQVHSLSRRLLATYLRQPYEFFLGRHSSDLATNIVSEAEEAVREYYRPAIELASAIMTTLCVTAVLASVNAQVAVLAAIVLGGSYGGSYQYIRRRLRRLGRMRSDANAQRYRIANESLRSIKDVKVLGREDAYLARFERPSQEVEQATIAVRILGDVPRLILQAGTYCAAVLFCLLFVSRAEFESGQALRGSGPLLGVFALAGQRLVPEFQRLMGMLVALQYGTAAVEKLHDDLTGATGQPPPGPRLRLRNTLSFERVSYAYPGGTTGLSEVSFHVNASEKIGIVGSSGAGKSTLGDIVLALLAPTSGMMCVDGIAIDFRNRGCWQKSVGFVPQDISVIDASVVENIALGLAPEEIDTEKVRLCARMANIEEFVAALPEGFHSHVGEGGVRLSGGQRQRLAIARALYQDVDLIVFDEATSALDNLTESEVMTALHSLPGEKTLVIIAHRLSTLAICNRIVVLKAGRLVGIGSRSELMIECEEFQRLARGSEKEGAWAE